MKLPTPCPTHEPGSDPRADAAGRRILVADDLASFRSRIARRLEQDGHHVTQIADGGQLLEAIDPTISGSAPSFDLVIAHAGLPRWKGLDVVAGICRMAWVPAVILISSGGRGGRSEAERLRAAAVFDRTLDMEDLRRAVCQVLGDGSTARQA